MKKHSKHGGKRAGAGRPSKGKKRYTVYLTKTFAEVAKTREDNFSGYVDGLLIKSEAEVARG